MSQVQCIDGSQFPSTVISSQSTRKPDSVSFQAIFDQTKKKIAATSNATDLQSIFQKAADTYGIDVDLLKAVAKVESNYNTTATSSSGAMGIMQLMPSTAKSLGITNAYDASQNILGGARLLASHIQKYNGDITLALAAYNAGSNAVDSYNGIPPFKETQNYVRNVLSYYNKDNIDDSISNQRVYAASTKKAKTTSAMTGEFATLRKKELMITKEQLAISKELEGLKSNDIYLTSNTQETISEVSDTDYNTTSLSAPISETNQDKNSATSNHTNSSDNTYQDYVDHYLNIISGYYKDNSQDNNDLFNNYLLGNSNSSYTSPFSASMIKSLQNTLASTKS